VSVLATLFNARLERHGDVASAIPAPDVATGKDP
jgi:hypothetical protein